MKSKLTNSAATGLGVGVGTAIYELISEGVGGADWVRPLFVGAFTFVIFLVVLALFGGRGEKIRGGN